MVQFLDHKLRLPIAEGITECSESDFKFNVLKLFDFMFFNSILKFCLCRPILTLIGISLYIISCPMFSSGSWTLLKNCLPRALNKSYMFQLDFPLPSHQKGCKMPRRSASSTEDTVERRATRRGVQTAATTDKSEGRTSRSRSTRAAKEPRKPSPSPQPKASQR